MRLKTAVVLLAFGVPLAAFSQIERSAFTATGRGVATTFVHDYQSIGINPANLAWTDKYEKRVAFGIAEGGMSLYSEALGRKEFRESISGFDEQMTNAEKFEFAREFANTDLTMDIDMQLLGLAINFNDRKWGGIAFSIRDRINYNSVLNTQATDILFLGWNATYFDQLQLDDDNGPIIENTGTLSQDTLQRVVRGIRNEGSLASDLFAGSHIKSVWYREYNLSYGREVVSTDTWMIGAGFGVKYVQGIAFLDIDVNRTDLHAVGAMTPSFGIDYGDAADSNPSNQAPNNNSLPSSVGTGFGLDFGLNFVYKDKLRFGAALNNIGSVVWDGNVYHAQDTIVFDIRNDGFNSLNVIEEAEKITGKNGVFKQEGDASETIALPTNFRAGLSYQFSDRVHIGADFLISLNDAPGSFQRPVYGVGGDYEAFKWLRLSIGYMGGGNYDHRIPVGITFVIANGTWEAGVASRDLVTFLKKDGAVLSASLGFLRFRVGKIPNIKTEALY